MIITDTPKIHIIFSIYVKYMAISHNKVYCLVLKFVLK